jgi:hypothetical protein
MIYSVILIETLRIWRMLMKTNPNKMNYWLNKLILLMFLYFSMLARLILARIKFKFYNVYLNQIQKGIILQVCLYLDLIYCYKIEQNTIKLV